MPRSARRAALAWRAAALVPMVWTLGACAELHCRAVVEVVSARASVIRTRPRAEPDPHRHGVAGVLDDPGLLRETWDRDDAEYHDATRTDAHERWRRGFDELRIVGGAEGDAGGIEVIGAIPRLRGLGAGAERPHHRHEDASAYVHERAIAIPPSTD